MATVVAVADPILEVKDLQVDFGGGRDVLLRRKKRVEAARAVNLAVGSGEAFAIIGESGAGKSTVARCIAGLQRPTSGQMLFDGAPLRPWKNRDQRRAVQMVFQDPYGSLNPRRSVGSVMVEAMLVNKIVRGRRQARARASELLATVGLPAAALDQRPRAFSGGQRQRIGIARALALEPRLLIADEAVSALDVSIQASVLFLLRKLQRERGLTLVFISHDLAVVGQLCDRVAVMKRGRVVEEGRIAHDRTGNLFERVRDGYTRELVAATAWLPPREGCAPEEPGVVDG